MLPHRNASPRFSSSVASVKFLSLFLSLPVFLFFHCSCQRINDDSFDNLDFSRVFEGHLVYFFSRV